MKQSANSVEMIANLESVAEASTPPGRVSGCEVVIDDERWDASRLPSLVAEVVTEALTVCGRAPSENLITVALTNDAEVRRFNASYRGYDKPTNVLSFPSLAPLHDSELQETRHLGDVLLAYETVAGEADMEGKSLADHAAHLSVHGALHICGYDHDTDEAAQRMESLEREILARFAIGDPYSDALQL